MTFATRITAILATVLTLATGATPALAHSDAPHPDALKAMHGGQLGGAGTYSYELVVVKDAKYASTPDMKVLVAITLSGKQVEQTRFTPMAVAVAVAVAVAKDGHTDHAH